MNSSQLIDTLVSGFIDKNLAKPSAAPPAHPQERSLTKGLIAGLAAGILATAAKTVAEKIYPPRTHGQPEPAQKAAGDALASSAVASETIHWGFGMTAGAAYGALAEFHPAATSREGVNFGMTLMALTHDTALPAMGLSAPPNPQTTREKTSELASHIIFGLVTETVRRSVRKLL